MVSSVKQFLINSGHRPETCCFIFYFDLLLLISFTRPWYQETWNKKGCSDLPALSNRPLSTCSGVCWWVGKTAKGTEATVYGFVSIPYPPHQFLYQQAHCTLLTKGRVQEWNWNCGHGFIYSVVSYAWSSTVSQALTVLGPELQQRTKQARFLLMWAFHSSRESVTWQKAHKKWTKSCLLLKKRCK